MDQSPVRSREWSSREDVLAYVRQCLREASLRFYADLKFDATALIAEFEASQEEACSRSHHPYVAFMHRLVRTVWQSRSNGGTLEERIVIPCPDHRVS